MENSKQRAEEQYLAFVRAFVSEMDEDRMLDIISEDFCSIGLLSQAPSYGKQAFIALMKQCPANSMIPLEVSAESIESKITPSGDVWILASILLRGNALVQTEHEVQFYQTAILRNTPEGMKLVMLHSSMIGEAPMKSTVNSGSELIRRHYRTILDALPMPCTITDNELRILFINRFALDLLQKSLWECIGKPCAHVWQMGCCATERCGIACMRRGERAPDMEIADRYFKLNATYLKDLYGNPIGAIEIGYDVTELKKANEKFISLSENIPGGVCEIARDKDMTLLYGNDGFFRLLGYTSEQFYEECQNKLAHLIDSNTRKSLGDSIDSALNASESSIVSENRIIRRDGTPAWILVYGKAVKGNTVISGVVVDITERKRVEQELRITEERLRAAMEKNSNFVFEFNIQTRQVVQPDAISDLYGLPRIMENAPDSIVEMGILTEDTRGDFQQMYREIVEGQPSSSCLIKARTVDQSLVWNKITMTCIYSEKNEPVRAIGLIEDVTQEKMIEMAYFQEEQYRNAMLTDVVLYIEMNLTLDNYCKRKGEWNIDFDGDMTYCYSRILDAIIQNSITCEYQQQYQNLFCRENALRAFENGQSELKMEYRRVMENERIAWMQTTMTLVKDVVTGDVKGFMYVRDIDLRKQAELRLEFASQHDQLTGSFNKIYTESLIREILEKEPDKMHAFLIFDIDYFKKINDTYGHFFGDQVLRETARVLTETFGTGDVIGRIGGDEFAVLTRDIPDREAVSTLAGRVCERFGAPLSTLKGFPKTSCSIGICIYQRGNTFETIYCNADHALYQAKSQGKNRYVCYSPEQSSLSGAHW